MSGGANLAFASGITSVNGLASLQNVTTGLYATTGTVTMPASGALTVNQTVSATFAGQFIGTPGALTVTGSGTLALTGDLSSQIGLTSVTVSGGTLQVDNVNTKAVAVTNGGTLDISDTTGMHSTHDQYTGLVTGSGNVSKVGPGWLFINDTATTRYLQNTGLTTVAAGTLGGNFTTSGGLTVGDGVSGHPTATLAPGNSPGTVTVNGNFTVNNNGVLAIEINSATSDKVVVNGTATIHGVLTVSQDDTPGSAKAAGAQQFTIISTTGGVTRRVLERVVDRHGPTDQQGISPEVCRC